MAYFRCMASGTGTGATITVSYESEVYGQTLTCTDGSHTYTKTAASSGSTVFTVPNGGTWTISVVMYGHTYSQQVIVVSDYTCTLELWSATVNISTTATELYGQTITVKKGGSTIGSTAFNSSGSATYIAPEEGAYTFECTYSGQTYSNSVNVTEETTYSVVISMGFDLSTWLTDGGLDPSDYADLSEVLADEEAVRRLMTKHASVDYLATASAGDEMMETIIADDVCAKWINLRDYALDTLYANSDIADEMDDAGKYFLGEWVLEGQVPVMTSDTAPYGEAICGTTRSGFPAYKAFDGVEEQNNCWMSNLQGQTDWIGYKFQNPVCIKKMKCHAYNNSGQILSIQASNDGSTWTTLKDNIDHPDSSYVFVSFDNDDYYLYYRVSVTPKANVYFPYMDILQFYAYQPKGNIPIMTSNTTPYGEAIRSSVYNSSYEAWLAFNGVVKPAGSYSWAPSYAGYPCYLGYHFTNPICVKRARFSRIPDGRIPTEFKFQGSNDGSTWKDVSDVYTYDGSDLFFEANFDNNDYYLYYRMYITKSNYMQYNPTINTLQFYGREMKVSVPTMTSNTQPWGEAKDSNNQSAAWYMFDNGVNNNISYTANIDPWCQYDFGKPICIRSFGIYGYGVLIGNSYPSIKIQGSNDGTTFTDVYDIQNYTIASGWNIVPFDNDSAFRYYRALYTHGSGSLASVTVYDNNFFGFDYSERDWDTEHPMRYLYDHGVDFVEDWHTYGDPAEFYDSYILTGRDGGQSGIQTNFKIDLSDYDLARIISEDYIKYPSAPVLYVGTAKMGEGSATIASVTYSSDKLPFGVSLDISEITSECYVQTINTNTASNQGKYRFQEWWLE